MEDTVFSKIIRREIPVEIIYEDEHTLAFLDQMPDTKGHTLVVPKKATRNIFSVDEDELFHVMRTVRAIAPKIRDAVGATGMKIQINNEPAGGQVVFHLHVHLVPFSEENAIHYPEKQKASPEELAAVAETIRKMLI